MNAIDKIVFELLLKKLLKLWLNNDLVRILLKTLLNRFETRSE